MGEIEVSPQEIDPFSTAVMGSKREEIKFVNSKCMTCGEMGEWVHVTRDESGRVISCVNFDVEHYKATGGKKGNGHKKFHYFTVTRNTGEVYNI